MGSAFLVLSILTEILRILFGVQLFKIKPKLSKSAHSGTTKHFCGNIESTKKQTRIRGILFSFVTISDSITLILKFGLRTNAANYFKDLRRPFKWSCYCTFTASLKQIDLNRSIWIDLYNPQSLISIFNPRIQLCYLKIFTFQKIFNPLYPVECLV